MSTVPERVRDLVAPMAAARDLEIYDIDYSGGVLRVYLDREGGAPLDLLAEVTRELSRALDDADPISGRYTLEVSSPGLERRLRTPAHFRWAEGRGVHVRRVAGVEGPRRASGRVLRADDDAVTLVLDEPAGDELEIPYGEIDRARTTFEWGGAPKPGGKRSGAATRRSQDTEADKATKAGG